MIKFEGVFLQYVPDFYSLYDFNCTINSNTLFVGDFFDGTNSIMRLLSKIDTHYQGNIILDDLNLKNIMDKDLNISYLPDNPVIFKNKSIFKNLYFPLNIRKVNKHTAKKIIESFIESFKSQIENCFTNYNTDNFSQTKVKHLNLSEQKIIALMRTAIRAPKYVLLQNFFQNLNTQYHELAVDIINIIKQNSTIIACEKTPNISTCFDEFYIITLSNGNIDE